MWYGVWNLPKNELVYSSAGHPPAVLASGDSVQTLRTPGAPIGSFPDPSYRAARAEVGAKARLIVFSDGVYELPKPDGSTQGFPEFLEKLKARLTDKSFHPDGYLKEAREASGSSVLEDDFSMLEVLTR
jgi:sigma-B regulation protein RsbU (phosphoserine phosphatase)